MTDYPKQIYISNWDRREITDPTARENLEKAYDYGKASVESLDGWSNLTQAIKEEADIDWVKLDGLPAKCVHPEMGTLTYKLDRDDQYGSSLKSLCSAWWRIGVSSVWVEAFKKAWRQEEGWTLWIKGEIPLRPKTADQLPAGMCFEGKHEALIGSFRAVMVELHDGKGVLLVDRPKVLFAEDVEVVKEYGIGTFKES